MKRYRIAATLSLAVLFPFQAAGASAGPTTHEVVIEAMRFTPPSLDVARGDSITWINRDIVPHNVTAAAGGPRSADLAPGASWTFRATKKGRYAYRCTLHPAMEASLTVK